METVYKLIMNRSVRLNMSRMSVQGSSLIPRTSTEFLFTQNTSRYCEDEHKDRNSGYMNWCFRFTSPAFSDLITVLNSYGNLKPAFSHRQIQLKGFIFTHTHDLCIFPSYILYRQKNQSYHQYIIRSLSSIWNWHVAIVAHLLTSAR
jgi:hypothetical protein